MVTHAGLNSVKECISMGVPMVALPVDREQPGNAARVVFHGLGVTLNPRRVKAPALAAAIDGVRKMPGYRLAVQRMQAAFARRRDRNEVVGVVAAHLRSLAEESSSAGEPARFDSTPSTRIQPT